MKILVVEDSYRLRKSIDAGLTKLNFVVDTASDGKEALGYIQSYDYDVILLDIMLPIIDGLGVLRKLRDKKIQTGVIMLTALDQVTDRVKGLELGADDYLCKPFAFQELVARINTVGRRNASANRFEMTFGSLIVDIGIRELRLGDKPINLTPTEYAIVECLALRAGKLVSFETLEELLSSSNKYMTRNALEVNIFNIRKKLKTFGKIDFIKTKRGSGYFVTDNV